MMSEDDLKNEHCPFYAPPSVWEVGPDPLVAGDSVTGMTITAWVK